MPDIYTDGHQTDVSDEEAAELLRAGLVQPHPGVGEDGIVEGDLKLEEGVEWARVYDALHGIRDPFGTRPC